MIVDPKALADPSYRARHTECALGRDTHTWRFWGRKKKCVKVGAPGAKSQSWRRAGAVQKEGCDERESQTDHAQGKGAPEPALAGRGGADDEHAWGETGFVCAHIPRNWDDGMLLDGVLLLVEVPVCKEWRGGDERVCLL